MRLRSWCTAPMPAASASRGAGEVRPAGRRAGARPRRDGSTPVMILISVDLPGAVLAHQRVDLAAGQSRARPRRAPARPGKALLTPRASRRVCVMVRSSSGPRERTARQRLSRPAARISAPSRNCTQEGIDLGEHQAGARSARSARRRAWCRATRHVAAGQRRAADDRRGEGEEQPVVADRRLAEPSRATAQNAGHGRRAGRR